MKKFIFLNRSASVIENGGGRNLMLEELSDNNLTDLQSHSTVLEDCPKYLRTKLWNNISSSSFTELGEGSSPEGNNTSYWSHEGRLSLSEDFNTPKYLKFKLSLYKKLLYQAANIDIGGSDSSTGEVIRRDVPRTYPTHPQFSSNTAAGKAGQMTLARVLRAYSLFDPEVSYCQGMAFIAGLLLMYLEEEMAFAGLVKLMKESKIRSLYLPSMSGLRLMLFQLEKLLESQLPDVHQHFLAVGIDLTMIATSWFMTAFASDFPLRFASRVLDILLAGLDYNIMVKIGFVLIDANKTKAMGLTNMEDILSLLRKEVTKRSKEELRDIISQALSGENFPFFRGEDLQSFKDEFESIQPECHLPSEVGDVLSTSDAVNNIDEIQAPDYLSMLMEFVEIRSDPEGFNSATPVKPSSAKGLGEDSIFPEEDELDELQNNIGEASFPSARRQNRMSTGLVDNDSLYTRSWGEYKADEAADRFLISDESPDSQEVNESFRSRDFMASYQSNGWKADDRAFADSLQLRSVEEDASRDVNLLSDGRDTDRSVEAVDSESSNYESNMDADEKSHLEDAGEEALATQKSTRQEETQVPAEIDSPSESSLEVEIKETHASGSFRGTLCDEEPISLSQDDMEGSGIVPSRNEAHAVPAKCQIPKRRAANSKLISRIAKFENS